MAKKKKSSKVGQLLSSAARSGSLSQQALAVLDVPDLGAQIQAGLGVKVEDVESSEVVLVSLMPDDSSSIGAAHNDQALRDGHNLVLDALLGSGQSDDVLLHTRYLNGHVLNPFTPLQDAVRMDASNYNPGLGTPLYDQSLALLGTVVAKSEEFMNAGVPVRTVTLILTDGSDQHSRRASARDVCRVVDDLARQENHIVAGLGVSDGHTDFRAVFREMGIEDRWILTPGSGADEIRSAFRVFSQSVLGATGLARVVPSAGGFLN